MNKLLKPSELNARIKSGKVLVECYKKTQDLGFLKKAISMLLFREHGLENYQPLYISHGAINALGTKNAGDLMRHLSVPRSRIFPATSGKIRKMGHDYADFVVEHVVDVSSMVSHLLETDIDDLKKEVYNLGRTCPICIVTSEEDKRLKKSNRENVGNPWKPYDEARIHRTKIRNYCGPLETPYDD